jgi:hypothetical protein
VEGERATLLRERPRRLAPRDASPVDDEAPPGRAIVRRPGLPTGRAILGALLVALAIIGLFVAYQEAAQAPSTTFAVVSTDVAAGAVLTEADVSLQAMELSPDVAAITLNQLSQVRGAVALAPLRPGQLLQIDDVLLPGNTAGAEAAPSFEFSLSLDPSRSLAGALQVGEVVDLVGTFGDGLGCSVVVAQDAIVRRVSTSGDELLGPAGEITLTLAIDQPDRLLQTIYAIDEAALTVVRSTRAGELSLSGQFCLADLAPNQAGS